MTHWVPLCISHSLTHMYTHTHAQIHIHGNKRGQYKCDLQMSSYVKWLNTYLHHHHTGSPQSRHYWACQPLNAPSQTHTQGQTLYRPTGGAQEPQQHSLRANEQRRRALMSMQMLVFVSVTVCDCGNYVKWRLPLGGSLSGWLQSLKRLIFAASVAAYLRHKQCWSCSFCVAGCGHFIPGKKCSATRHFIKFVPCNLTVNISFIVIYLNAGMQLMFKKMNNFVGLSRYMSWL